jgi:hypothetical protein
MQVVMGKSKRFGSDNSYKSHQSNDRVKSKKHIKSGWAPKRSYSDRDINRRLQQGDLEDYD